MTAYQMAINNVKRHIANNPAGSGDNVTAFEAAAVLAIAFCKTTSDVVADLIA